MKKAAFLFYCLFLAVCLVVGCGDSDEEKGDGSDADADADGDGDSDGDADGDDNPSGGDDCTVQFSTYTLKGKCQQKDANCPGGTVEDSPGDCSVTDLVCCINDNECESGDGEFACQEEECLLGMQIGCPNSGYCCPTFGITTKEVGDECVLSLTGLKGKCIERGNECEGGISSIEPGGDCGGFTLRCCIGTNQCENATSFAGKCQADDCPADTDAALGEISGFQLGCPQSKPNCCVSEWLTEE